MNAASHSFTSKGHWAPDFADFPELPPLQVHESFDSSTAIDSSEFLFADESWHSLLQVEANFDRAEECWIIHVINLAIPQLVSRVCALICLLHPRVHPLRQGFAFAKETVRTDHRTFVEVYVKTKRHTPRQYTLLDVSTAVALDPSRR